MDKAAVRNILKGQAAFFDAGHTKALSFRTERLEMLRSAVVRNEQAMLDALQEDLGKPAFEAFGGDVGIVLSEINLHLRNIRKWAKPRRAKTPLHLFPSSSRILFEPYGVVVIFGTWNFPFQLTLMPLVGSLSAGNCSVVRTSELAPASSRVLAKMIGSVFDPHHVAVVEGGDATAQTLLEERADYLFFTGSPNSGKEVMAAAARHLTPVTLELGGKNPCIVTSDDHLMCTAKRIVWGKFLNAGQSCVAVDYVLVERRIKRRLIDAMRKCIEAFYGTDPRRSPDYARIVNERHFDRLQRLLQNGTIAAGGRCDRSERYIEPTILTGIEEGDPVMAEEIFGPLLPVMGYEELDEAIARVRRMPKPLALYVFANKREHQQRILQGTASGGSCINDTVVHETTCHIPFGGIGSSGIGSYHGLHSFETFSHRRSVVSSSLVFDNPLRYPPYGNSLNVLKRLLSR